MESLAMWATQVSVTLGIGSGNDARNGLQFKEKALKKKRHIKAPRLDTAPPEAEVDKVSCKARAAPKTHWAKATLPLDIWFEVPNKVITQKHLFISGPHGPLQVELPAGAEPGQHIRHRLGPKLAHVAVVPEGAGEGDLITTTLRDQEKTIQVTVPHGKKAGDEFEVSPPVIMVQVPEGAKAGDTVIFSAPDGQQLVAEVPPDVPVSKYFEVPYQARNGNAPAAQACDGMLRTKATPPLDISFDVPEVLLEARSALVMGPHGPVALRVPENAKPGERVTVRLGPTSNLQAKVPEGLEEGDLMTIMQKDGSPLQITVPIGKKAGDDFEISPPVLMVRVPEEAQAGSQVVFNGENGSEMIAVVPEGFPQGSYFEVPLISTVPPPAARSEAQAGERETAEEKAEDKAAEEKVDQKEALGDSKNQSTSKPAQGDKIQENKTDSDDLLNFMTPVEDKENVHNLQPTSPIKACLSPVLSPRKDGECLENGSSDLLTGGEVVQTDLLA